MNLGGLKLRAMTLLALLACAECPGQEFTTVPPPANPARVAVPTSVQLAMGFKFCTDRSQESDNYAYTMIGTGLSGVFVTTAFKAPPDNGIDRTAYSSLEVQQFTLDEHKLDCQAVFTCTLANGLPYRAVVRVISTKPVPEIGEKYRAPPARPEFFKTMLLDGWVKFAEDPLAHQNPTGLPPLELMPRLWNPHEQSFIALDRAADTAELVFRVKVAPYVEAFWKFSDAHQIEVAEQAVRALHAANEKLAAAIKAREYPSHTQEYSDVLVKGMLARCDRENKRTDPALKLLALAREEFGKCRRVPAGSDAILGDTGKGWAFDNPAAAADFVPLADAYKKSLDGYR